MRKKIFTLMILLFISCGKSVSQWQQTAPSDIKNISSMATNGKNIFAGTSKGWIIRSTNDGGSWSLAIDLASTGDTLKVKTLSVSGSNVFAGYNGGIYLSRDIGINWRQALSLNSTILTLKNDGSNAYAGTTKGLYISTNSGASWQHLMNDTTVISAVGLGNSKIYVGITGGVYVSTNNGSNWKSILPLSSTVTSIDISETNIFVGTDSGKAYLSTNSGSNWTSVNAGVIFSLVYSVAIKGDNIYAATEHGNVYVSTDFGKTWGMESDNLIFDKVTSIALNDQYIYVGTESRGIWKRLITDLIFRLTGVEDKTKIPSFYELGQNYPNPFNPATKINYSIPKESHVSIKIFDALGREVKTLVNGVKTAGNFWVEFNAESFSSGIYFCTILAGNYTKTIKMTLLK